MLTLAQLWPGEGSAQPVGAVMFYAMAALTCLSAWSIVVSRNIVRMSVYLLLTLTGAAGMYFMLGAEFLAAIQLIVYAGGTLILIVFGIMLTHKHPRDQILGSPGEVVLGALIGLVIAALLVLAWVHSPLPATDWTSQAQGYDHVAAIGRELLSGYVVPFEVAAVLLLVVMIGAANMARRRVK